MNHFFYTVRVDIDGDLRVRIYHRRYLWGIIPLVATKLEGNYFHPREFDSNFEAIEAAHNHGATMVKKYEKQHKNRDLSKAQIRKELRHFNRNKNTLPEVMRKLR